MHDLVIRGGTILDGTGGPEMDGDVAIDAGLVTAIGKGLPRGAEEIDARGRLVTPGFVDIHTHYDGQAVWSNRMSPSSAHGVTSAVMGNCGVGFAPCRPDEHDMLIRLMEGVEDIPGPVLADGLTWEWENFPQYLEVLAGRRFDMDVAAQLPHAALRVYVMGQRGADREPATEADCAEMARIAAEAMTAGAMGFSTSRSINHKSSDGSPTPTLTAAEDELMAVAMGLKQAGRGVLQVISDFDDLETEFGMLRRLMQRSGRPMSISLAQREHTPDRWHRILGLVGEAVDSGLTMRAQVCGRPIGLLFGLDLTENPFVAHPSYRKIASLPLAERVAIMRQADFRAQLLSEMPASETLHKRVYNFDRLFPLNDPPDYEPTADQSIAARAAAMGLRPEELAYDLILQRDGRAILYRPLLNYVDGNLDVVQSMLEHRDTVVGLGDGGAHVGMICDASLPTYMLEHWVRDRSRGDRFDLPRIVRWLTRDTAATVGLDDRGVIAPGYKADLNVIDFDRLHLHGPDIVRDLPLGGRRLNQRADGYVATIVSGGIVSRDGEPTGTLTGRLVRGQQAGPAG